MTYQPIKNGKARRTSFIWLLCGILVTMASGALPYAGLFQLAGIVCVVVGTAFLVRYVLSDFVYQIDDRDDGASDFLVYKKQGQREMKVCHIDLAKAVDILPRADMKAYAAEHGRTKQRFSYTQNPGRAAEQVLLFQDGGEVVEVIFEPDAAFLAEVKKRIGSGGGSGLGFIMHE